MTRILALDYGKKRTGVAVTDPTGIIATSLGTVATHTIWDFLAAYFAQEEVATLLVGYPRQLNNEPSESLRFVNPFLKRFEKKYPEKKIVLMDERFTSSIARQTMLEGGVSKMKRRDKSMVDAISAVIILQSYMEQKANNVV